MLSQAALIEFHRGSADRGRSIFEGILRNFPKRLDLWSVYLDQVRPACWISVSQTPSINAGCVLENINCIAQAPWRPEHAPRSGRLLHHTLHHGGLHQVTSS